MSFPFSKKTKSLKSQLPKVGKAMCLATYNPGRVSLSRCGIPLWSTPSVLSGIADFLHTFYRPQSCPALPCPPPGEKGFRSIPSSPHLVSFDASRQCTVGRKFHPTSPSYHHHHHLCAGCWKMMKSLEGDKKKNTPRKVAWRKGLPPHPSQISVRGEI